MDKIPVTTIYQGKAWVADYKLRKAQKDGRGIILLHEKQRMTIPFEKIHPKFWTAGDRDWPDKNNKNKGKPYRLWGIKFKADKHPQSNLF